MLVLVSTKYSLHFVIASKDSCIWNRVIYLSNLLYLTAIWFGSSGCFQFEQRKNCVPNLCFYHLLYHLAKVAVTQRKLKRNELWWTLEMEFDCDYGGPEARASSPVCLLFALYFSGPNSIMQPHLWLRQKSVLISTSLFSDEFFKRVL